MSTNPLTTFKDATAGRLSPDRASRWLSYWDAFSSEIPDAMPEAEYANIALDAWLSFKRQDDDAQVDAVSQAWGIKRFTKLKPRPAARAARSANAKQPQATVVPAKKWEACEHWGGTRSCKSHEHAPLNNQQMQLANAMWKDFADFVKKRIHAEILPYTGGKAYGKFSDLEMETWWTISGRIHLYVPTETSKPFAWLRAVTHSVVVDHFRSAYSQKRDIRREVPTEFDVDRGIVNPADPTFAQPARPQGAEPDGSADPNGDSVNNPLD